MSITRSLAFLSVLSFLSLNFMSESADAQPAGFNYDEAKVPAYTLPDPLISANGTPVIEADAWRKKRRPEVLALYETQVYGRTPVVREGILFETIKTDLQALNGKALRKEVRVYLTGKKDGPKMDILIYIPTRAERPVPAFLGYNFNGNHSVHPDTNITLSTRWMPNNRNRNITNNLAGETDRGSEASRWAVDKILDRGYALATIYYGDVEPDFAEGWKTGARAIVGKDGAAAGFAPDAWGAIGAWAWGLSRALDYLERDRAIDAKRVAVFGHSRLGKTSLWAGAQDERFAMVISNNSGEGGAAITRRCFGETIERINTSFPHWFCGNFKNYNGKENDLPVDQHMLISLCAPRPVYVASAQEDTWADPRGEFLGAKHAEPVYRLLGRAGLGVEEMPPVNQPVGKFIGYHIRTGKHDVTDYDWDQYLNFADQHLRAAKKK